MFATKKDIVAINSRLDGQDEKHEKCSLHRRDTDDDLKAIRGILERTEATLTSQGTTVTFVEKEKQFKDTFKQKLKESCGIAIMVLTVLTMFGGAWVWLYQSTGVIIK